MDYSIASKGVIKGGSASYSVDSQGNVAWSVRVVVGWFFITKTIERGGTYHVDPRLLDPENIKPGQIITVGDLEIRVTSVDPVGNFDCTLILHNTNFSGNAVLEPSKPAVTPQSLDAIGTYDGHHLELSLRQVRGVRAYLPQEVESTWSRAVGVAMRMAEAVRFSLQPFTRKK